MIQIENPNIFGKVIAEALIVVDGNHSLQTWEKARVVNAIAKASQRMQDSHYAPFMQFDGDADQLIVWSDKSNQIYTVEGHRVCQCQAALNGHYCWHRAAKRLYECYLMRMAAAAGNRKLFGLDEVEHTEVSIREVAA